MARHILIHCLLVLCSAALHCAPALASDVTSSAESPAFAIPDRSFVDDPSVSPILATNLPPAHSQGGLPICCVEAARTLWLQNGCKTHHLRDCAIPDSRLPSILSFAAIANEGDGGLAKANNPLVLDYCMGTECKDPKHRKPLAPDIAYVLQIVNLAGETYSEACFSYDGFVNRFDATNPVDQANAAQRPFLDLRVRYAATRAGDVRTGTAALREALSAEFGVDRSLPEIEGALEETSFERFVHRILLGGCDRAKVKFSLMAISTWPSGKSHALLRPATVLSHVKDLLAENTPVGITLCLAEKPDGNIDTCKSGRHCVVLSGFRQVCNAAGRCMALLKVENSWGAQWQRLNNDGWVNADTLLAYADVGRSSLMVYFDP